MKISIRGKEIEITKAIEDCLKNKAKIFIKKFFSNEKDINIKCKLKIEKEKHVAEISIFFKRYIIRGESTTKDMYLSIDEAFFRLETQYKKHKDRLNKKNLRKKGVKSLFVEKIDQNINEEYKEIFDVFPEIIRRKKFILKPMIEKEAIMQMDLLGHNFYIYLDNKTNKIHIAYKRKEGKYGIIETEK